MSDPTLNYYVASGTAAEMAAFTPTPAVPAGGPDPGYTFYQTDTGLLFSWDEGGGVWVQVGGAGSGTVVQVVNTQTGAVATGTTVTPIADSIPQNTQGNEFMTLAITPTSAANKLKIDVVWNGAVGTSARTLTLALFQDSTADALAAVGQRSDTGGTLQTVTFSHTMTAGTTSATTFKVRVGVETSGTITFNGAGGARLYGGVYASSITITEYVP